MTSPILFDTKRHANRAHAVHRVIVLHHELPNFLGKPIVTVLRQDQFLLSKFVPVHSDDIAKMIEKIIDRLAELQSRPRTIPVLGHDTLGVEEVWHHVSWPQASRGRGATGRTHQTAHPMRARLQPHEAVGETGMPLGIPSSISEREGGNVRFSCLRQPGDLRSPVGWDPWLCVPRLPVVCLCQRHPTLCRLSKD